jgi:hypothetical protein
MLDPAGPSADDGGIQRATPRAYPPLVTPRVDLAPTEGLQIAFCLALNSFLLWVLAEF